MKNTTINLISGTILVFSIILSGACKKKESFEDKVGGCYDTDSPSYNGAIDYDDGTCKYAFVNMYEITSHPEQDPANSGTDWDLITNTEADLLLTIKTQIGQEVIFQSYEKSNHTYNVPAQWTAPIDIMLVNQNYEWELFDADDLDADDFIAGGTFNPIKLAGDGIILHSDTNNLNKLTELKLYYTLK